MPPNIGAVGPLAIFLFLTAATIIISLIVLSYAAYSFLVTLINTAAGCDEIPWPGDPFQDWIWMFWYLLWVGGVWAGPAVLVLGPIGLPRPLLLALVAAALWLLFPVSLLSSLSAGSRWAVYRPKIAALFFRHFGTSLRFYLLTGILGAALGFVLYLGLYWPVGIVLLPLSGALAATLVLIYARLLGRMGHLISWQSPGKRPRNKALPEAERVHIYDPWSTGETQAPPEEAGRPRPKQKKKKAARRPASKGIDPWAVPPQPAARPSPPAIEEPQDEEEDPLGPSRGSYKLMADDRPWSRPQPTPQPAADQNGLGTYDLIPDDAGNPIRGEETLPADPAAGYGVSPLEATAPRPALRPENPETARREEELARRREQPAPPARLLTGGVFSFPFYPTSLQAWATLAAGFFVVLGLVRALMALNPFPELGY
jgi:hypothetical protein